MASSKIGSIYAVPLRSSEFVFFQHIGFDETQMASEVIRVFKQRYPSEKSVELSEVIRGEVHFHAHTTIYFGLKLKLWRKVGLELPLPGLEQLRFRASRDHGNPAIKRSAAWEVWNCNQPRYLLGDLPLMNLADEIGLIFAPERIVNRIETGNYQIVHPHPNCGIDPTILPPEI